MYVRKCYVFGSVTIRSFDLDKFDELIVTDPSTYDEAQMRPSWEETLENIVSGAALVADRASTRPEVRP